MRHTCIGKEKNNPLEGISSLQHDAVARVESETSQK